MLEDSAGQHRRKIGLEGQGGLVNREDYEEQRRRIG